MPEESSGCACASFTDAGLAFCGESCLLVYKELGLPSALTYLFAFLRQHYPVTRIFCGFRHYRDAAFIPVADTLPDGVKTTQYLAGRSLTREQVRKMLVDDSRPYLFSEDPFPDAPHKVMRQEDFISHVRVPLFKLGEATFHMGFCSDTPNAFNERDAELLQRLTRPLSAELEHALHLQMERVGPPPQYEDCRALLRMCGGLADLLDSLGRVAATDYTVLIDGETGVGKDMVADAVHRASARRNRPLIKINCGAVSDSLLESELFGHEKGAFTGATTTRLGYFEAANGGTIFLDEIGELSPRAQAELLRVLDNREILRVGGTRCIPLDIRVIAATNRNLWDMVEEGSFREDLWYRINLFPLHVPPLRQRRTDIPVLVSLFTQGISSRLGQDSPPVIPPEEMERLYRHDWPGNVRELRNVVERAVIRGRSGKTCLPLRFDLPEKPGRKKDGNAPAPKTGEYISGREDVLPEGTPPTLEELGDRYVAWMLRHTGGKVSGPGGAAELLGVHPNTVRERSRRGEQRAASGLAHTKNRLG